MILIFSGFKWIIFFHLQLLTIQMGLILNNICWYQGKNTNSNSYSTHEMKPQTWMGHHLLELIINWLNKMIHFQLKIQFLDSLLCTLSKFEIPFQIRDNCPLMSRNLSSPNDSLCICWWQRYRFIAIIYFIFLGNAHHQKDETFISI